MIKITGYLDAFDMFERNGWNYDLKQSEENNFESVFLLYGYNYRV